MNDAERIKLKMQISREQKLLKKKVVECPSCGYRMMKQFWSKITRKTDCPGCGASVLDYVETKE